ncbi:response regulator transcription factor [Bacillus horti]|uniref:DNA-binding response OmpR family regulator n=1 Tax=Caldalkalibacillus horti TaxID=77523 RepID=A0ABT9W0I7_9BACI|nr:response regulator transcription factor [Bacillus horti]MDQ0166721.1 DNA-binding response OmpR family regulator [Bacillus horti]
MNSILVVEDNEDLNLALKEALELADYQVTSAYTGTDALKELEKNPYDLILLDIMLPYKSGDEVLKQLRTNSTVPVIMISAKDLVGTKVDLLKLGADDYITKPFDLDEVVARVASNIRRSQYIQGNQLDQNQLYGYKSLTLNAETKSVTVHTTELELTAKEYMILELLLKSKGKVFSKANLYESVWQEDYFGDDNVIKTHVSNLRNKLKKVSPEEDYIETVWGMGYRLYKD